MVALLLISRSLTGHSLHWINELYEVFVVEMQSHVIPWSSTSNNIFPSLRLQLEANQHSLIVSYLSDSKTRRRSFWPIFLNSKATKRSFWSSLLSTRASRRSFWPPLQFLRYQYFYIFNLIEQVFIFLITLHIIF